MPQHVVQLKISVILLVGIAALIPTISSLDEYNVKNPRYEYVDVARAIAGSRNKGQTTRIITANEDLDEKFWLKYLGEDFRKVVHLQVDNENNVIPLIDVARLTPSPSAPTNTRRDQKEDKRTRFARQPAHKDNNKQLPVENDNQTPTDKPETLNTTPNTATATPTTIPPPPPPPPPTTNQTHYSHNTQPHFGSKKPSNHKLHPSNRTNKKKFVKAHPRTSPNNTKKPIVISSPARHGSAQHANATHLPVVMQLPPAVYHQKTAFYPKNKSNRELFMHEDQLYSEQFPNLYLNNQNVEFYSQPPQPNTQQFYPPHITRYTTLSHPTHFADAHKTTTTPQTATTPSLLHTVHNT